MSSTIELEPLKPFGLKNDNEIIFFERIVQSYSASYFNIADVPLLEIYSKTNSEIITLYDALSLAGSLSDEKNKRYEKISRMIDAKVKTLVRLGSALRINPQQRRAVSTTRQDAPEDVGRISKTSSRDEITHVDVWENRCD